MLAGRRRLESSLLHYSRQSLPRHVRYSTPTSRVSSPALATAPKPAPVDLPAFMPAPSQSADGLAINPNMQGFLKRRSPYTIIPTPLPSSANSLVNDYYFTDSPTQDMLSIMDACLHNCHDVPRASGIFMRIRNSQAREIHLDHKVYNSFLNAYVQMAVRDPNNRARWVDDACVLYEVMESGEEGIHPSSSTYALMLLAWRRFHPESDAPLPGALLQPPRVLLSKILERNISVAQVVADRAISTSEEAVEIITMLSKAAVEMHLGKVVTELGQVEHQGRSAEDPLEDVPDVLPVKRPAAVAGEKGNKLEERPMEVPFNLANLRKHLGNVAFARRVLPEDVTARQKLLEESVYDLATDRLKHEAELMEQLDLMNKNLRTTDLRKWMWEWHQQLEARLREDIPEIAKQEANLDGRQQQTLLSPYLIMLKPTKLSLITILELMRLHGSGGVADGMKTARALISIGRAIELEYKAEMCKKNDIQVPDFNTREDVSYFTNFGYRNLFERRVTAAKHMEDSEEWTADWTQLQRIRVGSFLVDGLMEVAKVTRTAKHPKTGELVTEEQPAFFHAYEYVKGQKLGVIRLNPAVAERMAKDSIRETLHPRHLPMLIKPQAWLNYDKGGYLFNKSQAMRFKESKEQQVYLQHASNQGHVELVYAGLDVLGSTPWVINRRIFDAVLSVWNSGKRFGKIPPETFDGVMPEEPADDSDAVQKQVYRVRLKKFAMDKASNHSERCSVNYKIEIARAFLGDKLWLPHNLDFRGRAYPIPPHLNHIGDDLSRGLLLFGEKRPLGERGLRWLKIHLANLYGFDKASFDERVEFVHDRLEEIADSAMNPLEGKQWWRGADDPWQCLACCMELHDALQSPDPEAYESNLPVHQDGTCNGLQHYAALGGDAVGAQQVNLSVTDRPSDVYTYVANMCEKAIQQDLEKGDQPMAKVLAGKVSRKVVKQTVMTTVYGVTYIGARDQIEKQLKDRGDIPVEECWVAAAYLAKKVLGCIGDLFKGAKDIQNWLNLCARLISKSIPPDRFAEALRAKTASIKASSKDGKEESENTVVKTVSFAKLRKEQMTSVVWTTPLGLPIVQPYRKIKRKQIMTALQTVFISDPNAPEAVNPTKQASAFPPNFIHSLDATHMMLTALECRTQGLTFASVHDSYWTHAATIDDMSAIIRETFIALHSSDVLARLHEEFLDRYKGYKVPLLSLNRGKLHLDAMGHTEDSLSTSADAAAEDAHLDAQQREEQAEYTPIETGTGKRPLGRKAKEPHEDDDTDTKFVNLVDILPALPKKGDFEVSSIKKSLYFFS